MFCFLSRRFVVGLFLVLFAAACTRTVRKKKAPVFAVPLDSVAQGVYRQVISKRVNVDGWEDSTNGKLAGDQLEIQLFNGRNLPADDRRLETLGRSIAAGVRASLTDTNEYNSYRVVFVKEDSGKVMTKQSWRAFIYTF